MKIITTILLAVLAICLVSCQSATTSATPAPPNALRSGHWTEVSNDPPT